MNTWASSRRKFLKQTLMGVVVLGAAKAFARVPLSLSSFQEPPSLEYFSPQEYEVFRAVADRIIGITETSPLSSADLALRADGYLAAADPEVRDQFHSLLTVFNAPFFTFLFDWRLSSFLGMSTEKQDSYLEDWMNSNFAFRRTGFQALKRVCLSMQYTDPRSWAEIKFEGMFLPWER